MFFFIKYIYIYIIYVSYMYIYIYHWLIGGNICIYYNYNITDLLSGGVWGLPDPHEVSWTLPMSETVFLGVENMRKHIETTRL